MSTNTRFKHDASNSKLGQKTKICADGQTACKKVVIIVLLITSFVRLSDNAKLPVKGSTGAAGYDLASAEVCVVPAHGKAKISTDLAITVPAGVYGRIAPRSGLAWNKHIDVGAGVIDSDFGGCVCVILFNHSNDDLKVEPGDRVAQIILEKIEECAIVEEVYDLAQTERGSGGFGSTDVKSTKKPCLSRVALPPF